MIIIFNLGDRVRLLGASYDNVAGQIRGIQRSDELNDRDEPVVEIKFRVVTANGSFIVTKVEMSHEAPKNSKFTTPEEAEAWMEAQAGNSWTAGADDWLKELTDGS